MKEKAVTPTKHSTAYVVNEIYRTLSPKCSLDETTKMCNYICDNLEEIQKKFRRFSIFLRNLYIYSK